MSLLITHLKNVRILTDPMDNDALKAVVCRTEILVILMPLLMSDVMLF